MTHGANDIGQNLATLVEQTCLHVSTVTTDTKEEVVVISMYQLC